ncbi:hypothetical protein ACFFS2_40955 [Streptomyces aurantiacus]|uniref:HflX-like GTP-binding protein n=1 Tax=Streptomyces aurantiacus TaxID=47760 RepID=UPI001FE68FD0|nr:hypothetical protein [Streptomyces aurantiacus]
MHQNPRRGRRERRAGGRPRIDGAVPAGTGFVLAGADVLVAGYFSAKQKDFAALMDAAATALTARGARVVGLIVQRRGVSNGGAGKMGLPYSSRTLMSYGKVREVAALCERSGADAVVFLNDLTPRQYVALSRSFGCPAVSFAGILPSAPPGADPHLGGQDSGATGRP